MMTLKQRQQIKDKIIKDLTSVKNEIAELQELTKPIPPECALGDLARFELMNDQDISEKTLQEAKIRQNKLDFALSKIDKEEFGLCMECEEEISFQRLLILPESSHCIECASNQSLNR